MIPFDKFNNPIYPNIFKILKEVGICLINIGYKENNPNKQNLFTKEDDDLIYYMDMRGTKEVPIWEESSPAFYFFGKKENMPLWKSNRLIKKEEKNLNDNKIPFRTHFYRNLENELLLSDLLNVDLSKYDLEYDSIIIFESDIDGFCKVCGKDLQDYSLICSNKCKEIYISRKVEEIKNLEKEDELSKKKELEKRKLEKEKTNNKLIFLTGEKRQITGGDRQGYYKKFCNLNMDDKSRIRYLRQNLIKEGFIGYKKFCETKNCYNISTEIHEKIYLFDDLFKQDNYLFLCKKCHAKSHIKLKND